MNDIITVVRDPVNTLGKSFWIDDKGELKKRAVVTVSFGFATMHEVSNCHELEALLHKVGNDPNAAIINASFKGINIGEEFILLSEKELSKRLNLKGRENIVGVHAIQWNDKTYKAVCRLKENVQPSSWQLLDRDVDAYTPSKFAECTFDEWLANVDMILQVSTCDYLRVPSTSARVERV